MEKNYPRSEGKTSSPKYNVSCVFCLLCIEATIAENFGKTVATIGNWINRYEKYGHLYRKKSVDIIYKKFGREKREWILDLYKKQPMIHIDEACVEFLSTFGMKVSCTSVSVILHQAGMTYKVIERRAKEIKFADVMNRR